MESNKPNAENSGFSGTLNTASNSSTPANVRRDGSIFDSILSQIEERQPAYEELDHRYPTVFSAFAASGERMTDMVNSSTQTLIPDLQENAGQNLNRGNMSYQDISEYYKRKNVGLRVRAFYLSIKLHKYKLPESTSLDSKDHCSICLDDYCDKDELAEIECGHVFHVDCIKEWIKLKNSCPICKRDALAILTREPTHPMLMQLQ